jgi:hypothetical protein
MIQWVMTIKLPFFNDFSLSIQEKAKRIATQLRDAFGLTGVDFDTMDIDDADDINELVDVIYNLERVATFSDTYADEEIDDVLDSMYNWADDNRVFIDTFSSNVN